MKRKRPTPPLVLQTPEMLAGMESAALALPARTAPAKCVICGEDTSPTSNEGLCWVCRRLKISAWRDGDLQQNAAPQQE